jgi:hypothetical protein
MKHNDYNTIAHLISACKKLNIKYKNIDIIYYMCNLSDGIKIQTYNIIDAIKNHDYKLTQYLLTINKDCLNLTCLNTAVEIENNPMIELIFEHLKIYKLKLKILHFAINAGWIDIVTLVFNKYFIGFN